MKTYKIKAFTLVELIIVITILAILATIGFMSFQSYTQDARDINRITSIKSAQDGLEIYMTKKSTYPIPDTPVILTGGNTTIIQGILGKTVGNSIKLVGDIKDPKTNSEYVYSISGDGKYYQIGADLENAVSYNSLVNTTYAEGTKALVKGNYSFDPSLPSLITVSGSVNTSSGIFDPNVCFVIDGGTNLVSSTSTTCSKKRDISFKNFDSALVGYWDMESYYQSGGLYYLKDLSLNNNDGVFSGGMNPATLGTLTGGIIGKRLYFNGTGNYINIQDSESFYFPGDFSMTTWINTARTNNFEGIISQGEYSVGKSLPMTLNSLEFAPGNKIRWLIRNSSETVIDLSSELNSISLKTGYNITVKKEGNIFSIFINGNLMKAKTSSVILSNIPYDLKIGVRYVYGTNPIYVNSNIDDVKIYNRALSDSEITQQAKIAGF